MNNKLRIKNKYPITLFLLPSLLGVCAFYLLPFCVSVYYAFLDNLREKNGVGLDNLISLFQNAAFSKALLNTLLFIAIGVPLNMLISFSLASFIKKASYGKGIMLASLLLPMAVPSGTVAFFWAKLFNYEGLINKVAFFFGYAPKDWMQSDIVLLLLALIFVWKNVGYCVVVFLAGLSLIPNEYYEVAKTEGAGSFWTLRHVTFIYLLPVTFVTLFLSIVSSFKSFRDIYILLGVMPSGRAYMLQQFILSQFLTANIQKASSASLVITVIIVLVVVPLYIVQKNIAAKFSG